MGQVVRMHLPALLLFFLMSCAVTIYSHTDTVMLGAIKGTEEVGIYSCAAKVKMVLPVIAGSLWAAALPKAADLWQGRDKKTFEKLADSSFHTVQVIITPLVLYFVLFAGPFIGVIGGEEYIASVLPMQMLVLAILRNSQIMRLLCYSKKLAICLSFLEYLRKRAIIIGA